ncbi:DUF2892 domain-containing protein [Nitrosococcus wardiae]|uniref:DUF2892 domain-containing protein n=1 Tax=Nitrosococcus wardiae TaxID=1814290 RepID=A0A4P7C048_9GAMM|nr:DUF2892 domain-containing protein [Nitrosococcus wardiae]QBQ54076.1 DUF2892 domain-containing protein [Nitrosococcus wardiae]
MAWAETPYRVTEHTAEKINWRIEEEMRERLNHYALYPEGINQRLQELDEEWDIERTLEANAASFSLAGLTLGLAVNRKFLLLPLAVSAFLLQHAIQGWCPPLPLFRRLGVRTQHEIETERTALKILRGDFDEISHEDHPATAVNTVQR